MRLALLLAALLCGCAAQPYAGIAADAGTTAIGLSRGFTETNPIAIASLPIRVAAIEHAKTLAPHEKARWYHAISATSWGAAGANACLLVGGPLCIGVGVLVGAYVWLDGAEEREFYRLCEIHRQRNPDLKCEYTKG